MFVCISVTVDYLKYGTHDNVGIDEFYVGRIVCRYFIRDLKMSVSIFDINFCIVAYGIFILTIVVHWISFVIDFRIFLCYLSCIKN